MGLLIAALLLFALAVCGLAEEESAVNTLTNDGLTLSIPNEYAELLAVVTPDNSEDGNYYLFCHPTDVRLIRADNKEMDASMEQWTALNEWAATVPKAFLKDNKELTAQKYGNTDLDMYLAHIAYGGKTDYTISTTEFGPLQPNGVDPMPLLSGVTYSAES